MTSQKPSSMTSSPDIDMDKITKELLDIGVDSNGKILLEQNKHLNVASREDILPKNPLSVKNNTLDSSPIENVHETSDNVQADSSSIEGALKSMNDNSNVISMLAKNTTMNSDSSTTDVENVQQISMGQNVNSMLVQNKTLENTDAGAVQVDSPALQEPSNIQNTGDKKANLAPFFNRQTPTRISHLSRKLSEMQNELLREMYKSRTTNGGLKSKSSKAKHVSCIC